MSFKKSAKRTLSTMAYISIFWWPVGAAADVEIPPEIERLMSLKSETSLAAKAGPNVRQAALDLQAISSGSSAGLKWRYDQIMDTLLEPNAKYLDRIFNFSRFMADGKIYLPAVRVAQDDISFGDEKQTLVRVSYTVSEKAILRSSAPTFRDYLYLDFTDSDDPHHVLLPKNKAEETVWKEKIKEGFLMGVEQANDMYKDQLAEMRSDYLDRQNYLNLVAKNMISQPSILVQKNGITFNGRTMNVGEVVYQMSGEAGYLEESNWRSAWEK